MSEYTKPFLDGVLLNNIEIVNMFLFKIKKLKKVNNLYTTKVDR